MGFHSFLKEKQGHLLFFFYIRKTGAALTSARPRFNVYMGQFTF